ncbi:MAG: hypothetical protein HYX22_02905 [Candidatus Yanofskybacteria bacterium]|nr:hypothetical protein [Candidatus Yanofskybacteria bacterium]
MGLVIGNVDRIICDGDGCWSEFKHDPVVDDGSNSETKQAAMKQGWQFDSKENKWYCHWCWLHRPAPLDTCWSCGFSLSACICKFQPTSC